MHDDKLACDLGLFLGGFFKTIEEAEEYAEWLLIQPFRMPGEYNEPEEDIPF